MSKVQANDFPFKSNNGGSLWSTVCILRCWCKQPVHTHCRMRVYQSAHERLKKNIKMNDVKKRVDNNSLYTLTDSYVDMTINNMMVKLIIVLMVIISWRQWEADLGPLSLLFLNGKNMQNKHLKCTWMSENAQNMSIYTLTVFYVLYNLL